jgi:diaminopimelate epimerase
MKFTKMHALGNDFIVLDSRGKQMEGLVALSIKLCHRRFGIGADQVLVLEDSEGADFRMRIFNADGSEVEMCGNGIRALAKYVWDRGLSEKDTLSIETMAGIMRPAHSDGLVRVDMGEPELEGRKIPVDLEGKVVDHPLKVDDRTFLITCVSMGNPHAVIFVDKVEDFPVSYYGPKVENHGLFPNRINVEFVEVIGSGAVRVKVWERGAGETMACGTGACATAVASGIKGLTGRDVVVHLDGGDLTIEWAEDNRIYMTGPADALCLRVRWYPWSHLSRKTEKSTRPH